MTNSYAIQAQHLCKVFGDQVAVADLTLEVARGEVFGFLGPNGAGKTTAVKMLLGLVPPTRGSARVLGTLIGDPNGRAKVGFLPEHFNFHDWLKASEFLQLHADLYGIPHTISRQRIPELLDLVGLLGHSEKKLRAFSKGMLQRIGLAQALLNDPELVFLDEPTSGLDPIGRRLVRDVIHRLRVQGTTVFLNSHLLSEVEVTCDRVAFIRHGEIVRTSALDTLVDGELSVRIRVRSRRGGAGTGPGRAGIPGAVITGLATWCDNLRVDGEHVTFTVHSEADLPDIARYLIAHDLDLYAFSPQHMSLEDLFVEIVGTESEER